MAGTITSSTEKGNGVKGLVRINATVVVSSGGVATAKIIGKAFGRLVAVAYDGGLDNSADITLSDTDTGASLVSSTDGLGGGAAVYLRPTAIVTDNAGVAITPATTDVDTHRDIFVAGKVSLAVTAGGTSLTGVFGFVFDQGA